MVKSISEWNESTFRIPVWIFSIGLFGVIAFLIGFWALLPPTEEKRVYFWLVEFYSYAMLPMGLLFPICIFLVVLGLNRFPKRPLSKVVVLVLGIVLAAYGFVLGLGAVAFISTLNIIGKVEQNKNYYYLVKYYDDTAPYYLFCESDSIGFSGPCRYIGWKSEDTDPEIYIDQSTNWITVEAINPSFVWMNSAPPKCINSTDEWFPGGCTP